jgi:peptidoglycan/LPS O-acetylase OafA/YrhL
VNDLWGVRVGIPLSAAAAAVLVAGAHNWRLLTSPPLRHLGKISYALYLWDGVLEGVPAGWRVLLALACAEASTWLVERPARRWILSLRRRPKPAMAPSAA